MGLCSLGVRSWAGSTARVLLAAALSCPLVAHADANADEAEFHFRRALRLLEAGKLEDALGALYASNRAVPNVQVRRNIASVLGRLRRYEEAFRAYSELLSGAALPAKDQAEVVSALEWLRPRVALLRVSSAPPGGAVYLGRRDLGVVGTTPALLAVSPGNHRVLVELDGYRSAEGEVRAERGKEATLRLELLRRTGRVRLLGLPPQAKVRLEGASGGSLALAEQVAVVPSGRAALWLEASGYVGLRVEVEVPADAETTLEVKLLPHSPPRGALVVTANVPQATIRIDGEARGFTPAVIEDVRVGRRHLEVSHEGRVTWEADVEVEDGARLEVAAQLSRPSPQVTAQDQTQLDASRAAASVTVLPGATQRAYGASTLAEALRGVRGVHVFSDGWESALGLRGFSDPGLPRRRTLVLLDGLPLNDAVTGDAWLGRGLPVALADIERLELARGGSMVLGPSSFLGHVNLVSRRPAPGVGARLLAELASEGGPSVSATASAARGASFVLVGAGASQAVDDRLGARSSERSARLWAGWRGLSLTALVAGRDQVLPPGLPDALSRRATLRGLLALTLAKTFLERDRLFLRLGFDRWTDVAAHELAAPVVDRRDGLWATGELRFTKHLTESHRLTMGAELRRVLRATQTLEDEQEAALYQASETEWVHALFVGYGWRLSERLELEFGLRQDALVPYIAYGRTIDTAWVPNAAVLARPYVGGASKLLLHAGLRRPTLEERRFQDVRVSREPATLPDEGRFTVELEHSHRLSDAWTLLAAAHLSRYGRYQTQEMAGQYAGADAYAAWNTTSGAELELTYASDSSAELTLVYARTLVSTYAHLPTAQNSPQSQAAVRISWPLLDERLRLSMALSYDGPGHGRDGVPASLNLTATLLGTYPRLGLSYWLTLQNLTGERGALAPRAQPTAFDTRRLVRAGLEWSW